MPSGLTKLLALFISFCLILEQGVFAQSLDLSAHFANFGKSIAQTDKFRPLHLRYLGYDNLKQDFKLFLDKGDTRKEDLENKAYIEENTQTLLRYFFIGLSLPNDKFWVNLRPDSPDNILDPDLERTDIGRIFLEADLQLKKDTASFTSPQTPEGKAYWDKLYKKAGELFGTENITIPTLTRPWIVPNEIIIRESLDDAYIYKATLKVMLEEDYLQGHTYEVREPHLVGVESVYSFSDPRLKELNQYSTQLIKDLIIPKLTYEVNTSKRYAPLRQVYYSLILAQWFKQRFGKPVSQLAGKPVNPLTGKPANPYSKLIDSRDLTNLLAKEPYDKQTYFKQYQKSFKDGEYNLSEPAYTPMGQSIRRYMSGGMRFDNLVKVSLGEMVVGSPIIASVPSIASSSLTERIGRRILPYLLAFSILFTNSGCVITDFKDPKKILLVVPQDKDLISDKDLLSFVKLIIKKSYPSRDDPEYYKYRLSIPQNLLDEKAKELVMLFLKVAEGKSSLDDLKIPGVTDKLGIKDGNVIEAFCAFAALVKPIRREIILQGGIPRLFESLTLEGRRVLTTILQELLIHLEEIGEEEAKQIVEGYLSDKNLANGNFFGLTDTLFWGDNKNNREIIARLIVSSGKIPVLVELGKNEDKGQVSKEARRLLKYLLEVGPNNLGPLDTQSIQNALKQPKGGKELPGERSVPMSGEIRKSPRTTASSSLGGIDLTHLPIVTQAITNLGSSPLKPSSYLSLRQLNLSEEYQAIERLASSGLTPSPERLKGYLQASCLQDRIGEEKDNALGLLADVLRDEEFSLRPTEPELRDILVALESATSPNSSKRYFWERESNCRNQ